MRTDQVAEITPGKFYALVDVMQKLPKSKKEELNAFITKNEQFADQMDLQVQELSSSYNDLLQQLRLSTKEKTNTFRPIMDQINDLQDDYGHTIGGKNFLTVVFHCLSSLQKGHHLILDVAGDLVPKELLLSDDKTVRMLRSSTDLQHMMYEIQLNSPAIRRFIDGLRHVDGLQGAVLKLQEEVSKTLEMYYRTLLHRHSVDGLEVFRDAIVTDVAMSVYENVDSHGEIEEGKNPDEISAYTLRKAEIIADALKNGLICEFMQNPGEFVKFIQESFRFLWASAKLLNGLFKEESQNIKVIMEVRERPAKASDQEFDSRLSQMKDLDPRNVAYKEKPAVLSAEERFNIKFRNETLKEVVRLMTDPTADAKDLITYILKRKAELKKYFQDENSFYVCKIGQGNPFLGEAAGGLVVVPGERPRATLDDIVGSGFSEVKKFIQTIDDAAQWHDLFLATSPSKTTDKSNVLLVGPPGCHRIGQKILMYDGSLLPVEQIKVGHLLMGPDSTPRKVIKLHRGVEDMVEIIPSKGQPWVVNKGHILTLLRSKKKIGHWGRKQSEYVTVNELKDVAVSDYINWSNTQKHVHCLVRTGVDFKISEPLPLDPYFLGLILGDGCIRNRLCITTLDEEIVEEVYNQANISGLNVSIEYNLVPSYHLSGVKGKLNPITYIIRALKLDNCDSSTKFIPHIYKTASREDRLRILAGIINTDGSFHRGCYDYVSKSSKLAEDVAFVARSLGLAAYVKPCIKQDQNGTHGDYFRVIISGEINMIPVRIKRKCAEQRRQIKNVLHVGFTINHLPPEEFFGFTVDGDHRYLLDDFTITHNCGKSEILRAVASDKKSIGVFAQGSDFLTAWKGEAEKNPKRLFEAGLRLQKESKKHVHFLIDEIDSVLKKPEHRQYGETDLSLEFQILMDGVVHYPNLSVWGATNYPDKIPMAMIRRFSSVVIVGELSQEDRVHLLKQYIAGFLPINGITEENWGRAALRLEGATGDVMRKVADHIWREKMSEFVTRYRKEAYSLAEFLNEGEKFQLSTFDEKKRFNFKQKLQKFVQVSHDDLQECVTKMLANVAVKSEIETALKTYKEAKIYLKGIA